MNSLFYNFRNSFIFILGSIVCQHCARRYANFLNIGALLIHVHKVRTYDWNYRNYRFGNIITLFNEFIQVYFRVFEALVDKENEIAGRVSVELDAMIVSEIRFVFSSNLCVQIQIIDYSTGFLNRVIVTRRRTGISRKINFPNTTHNILSPRIIELFRTNISHFICLPNCNNRMQKCIRRIWLWAKQTTHTSHINKMFDLSLGLAQ